MKTYRDWARETKGITAPEIIAPTTAHAAFDKAAEYFGMKIIRIPVGPDFRADVAATEKAITPNTIALVGSAPPFPHGLVDPIEELSELARATRPRASTPTAAWAGSSCRGREKLGYQVPPLRLPPARRDLDLGRHAQVRLRGQGHVGRPLPRRGAAPLPVLLDHRLARRAVLLADASPAAGPGALSAACWAAMVSIGEQGYLEAARRILETDRLDQGARCAEYPNSR